MVDVGICDTNVQWALSFWVGLEREAGEQRFSRGRGAAVEGKGRGGGDQGGGGGVR
jgi:hypothetical protein